MNVAGHPEEEPMQKFLIEQNNIGWYFSFVCFWSCSWGEIQRYMLNLQKIRNIVSWKGLAQLEVWNYVHSLWEFRNSKIHGDSKAAKNGNIKEIHT